MFSLFQLYLLFVETILAKSKFSNPDQFLISSLNYLNEFYYFQNLLRATFIAPSLASFFVKYLVSIPYKQGILLLTKKEFKSFSALQFE